MLAVNQLIGFGAAADQGGAFPVAAASNTSSETGSVTSHDVSLPASIAAGDLLIVAMSAAVNVTFTVPSGWTQLYQANRASAERFTSFVIYKVASGSEGATVVVTSDISTRSAHNSWQITGAGTPTVTNAEVNNLADLTPPSHTPAGGSKKYLWLAVCPNARAQTLNSYPSGYSGGITVHTGTLNNNGHSQCSSCWKESEAASEDPGNFNHSSSTTGANLGTISIPPA